jgi:hypothetical protein
MILNQALGRQRPRLTGEVQITLSIFKTRAKPKPSMAEAFTR